MPQCRFEPIIDPVRAHPWHLGAYGGMPQNGTRRMLGKGRSYSAPPQQFRHQLVPLWRDESVVDLNPQIAHGALDLLVAQQKLDRPQIASATVYECRFGSAQ